VFSPGNTEPTMEHYLSEVVSLTRKRTPVGGLFRWGAMPSKRYRGRPKVDSGGSEIHRRVQE
jgi:hypothetical protein